MQGTLARGVGIDLSARGCRLALHHGSSRLVCSVSPGKGNELSKRHIGMQKPGNDARASELLGATRVEAERILGAKITGGILAVPPCFTDRQKTAAKACAEAAGFQNIGLIDESVAGAMFYRSTAARGERWLVYSLGKSTFSTTLIDARERVEVKGHNGDVQIGGEDFDSLVAAEVRRRGLVSNGLDEELLLPLAERCKRLLSFQEEAIVQDFGGLAGPPIGFTFRRDELEALLAGTIERTISLVRQTLEEGNFRASEIDRVLLLGESTRISLIERRIAHEIPAPAERLSVDSVCRGAAFIATRLGDCLQENTGASAESPTPPVANGVMKTYAAIMGAAGVEKLELYYRFLEAARNELAYLCQHEAAKQDGLARAKDAIATLEKFLEWKSSAGKEVVKGKLADLYYRRARDAYDQARAARRDDERKKALKDCRNELNKCLESNSGHAEAKRLKAVLPK